MRPLIRACIDTAALRSNLQVVRRHAPRSKVIAVVKANAYGHGLIPTAQALAGVDAFAVARLEEALRLREAGFPHRIVLLEGIFDAVQLDIARKFRLDLVVHQDEQLDLLAPAGAAAGLSLWIKVDTGMNRLGFRPEQFGPAWRRAGALAGVGERRVMTHLACADEADPAPTRAQLARLAPLLEGLAAEVSIANSAGVLAWPDAHREWVRPGLALYGVSPFPGRCGASFGLRPAMTLESTVIALRELGAGESVGYGASWCAARPTRLAIVAAGYGDGLLRALPNGTPVLIGGERAALAGRVSMDMIAVDVTDLKPVRVGDAVQLWGAELPVEDLAQAAGTIAYELLCAIRQRVPVEVR